MKRILAFMLIILSVGLAGCGEHPIQVAVADAEESQVGTETLDIRNCDTTEEKVTTLATEAPIKHQIQISDQATLEETGTPIEIPPERLDELTIQVTNAYQVNYDEAQREAEQVAFTIPAEKIYMYKIHWIRQTYRSTISFSIDRQPCTVDYEYSLEIPELDSITTMSCTA